MNEEQKGPAAPAPKPATPTGGHDSKPVGKIFLVVLILLLAVIGYLTWQWWMCLDHDTKVNQENQDIKSQNDTLKKQLDEAKKSANAGTTQPAVAPCTNGTASASLKDNISAAISSKNTAALQGYMASSVNVVIAASEKGGSETAEQATKDLDYTFSGTAPWNFALSASTIASYKAGFYKQYFPDGAYVGKAANSQVISFGFDCTGKINVIFMAASADLLT